LNRELLDGGLAVPLLLGIFLGIALTIAGAYEYDATTGRAANGLSTASADGQAPMVNWDVVGGDWQIFQTHVRATATDLEQKLKQHAG
jgi:hypothetical protein